MADNETIEELTRAVQALQQQIAQGKTVDPKEVDRLDKALKAAGRSSKMNTDAQNANTKGVDQNTSGLGRFAGAVSNLASGTANLTVRFNTAASDIRENRESFTSLNPAIKLTGDTIRKTGQIAGGVVDAFGDLLSGIPAIGGVVGGVVSGLGKIGAALAEAAGEIINTVGPMLTEELERASKAFRTAGQVGALGAEGLTGLANQAIDAGLSFSTFAGVINKTAPDLVFALGNSADAASALASTRKQMEPFRRGLLNLGISVEQQTELTAGFITLQQRLGRNQARDSRALAQGSANYIKNLTELSKLTGKSVSEQQKELDDQMRNVRAAAALRQVQAQLGPAGAEAVENIQGVTAVLKERAPNIAAGFADALGGNLGTEAARNFQQATGAAGLEIIQQLKTGQINRDEALMRLQEAGAQRYQSMGGDKFAMAVGGMGTALEPVILDLQQLTFGAKFGEQIGKVDKQVNATLNTQDKTTKSMTAANEALIRSAQALDKLALQTTLPLAATGIETFTTGLVKATTELTKYVGKTQEEIAAMLKRSAGLSEDTVETGDVVATTGMGVAGGAATGAAIGLLGGPLGAAIGAGIGGLLGGIGGFFTGKEGIGQSLFDFDDDSFLGSLFNKREFGGPVNPDEMYLVGEKGPELMIPDTAGTIMPNNMLPTLTESLGAMAGPAGGMMSGMDAVQTESFFNALERATPEPTTPADVAGTGNMQNAIGEAQIARLDVLINEMSNANQISTKILQAARS